MSKEKLISLNTYLSSLILRLESTTPEKHKNHPETYKQFLQREIAMVKKQLKSAKLEGAGK